MVTRKDIANAIMTINSNFSNAYPLKDKDIILSTWEEALKDFSPEEFKKAFTNVLGRSEYPPRIGSIVKECERLQGKSQVAEKSHTFTVIDPKTITKDTFGCAYIFEELEKKGKRKC